MLKALELSGFKSFADKTRFEFPAGITVVVGPNGSGKSNIVDGIKWVLGEQSAKSLRGKEMSDVIFKGSGGPNGRKAANAATATIILDNSEHRFPFDADEVHVSRRVYRSGESEYLINGQTSRLKDIRELFRGTGVGTDAYSLIEQGKVERMLSAQPKDRRAIFEEAAGISRFKAKKKDAERRLARVEGNLIRLADIVEEVGSRYRSVKAQASKAARFKEYTDRLQELRTHVGSHDWRQFSEKLETAQAEQAQHQRDADQHSTDIESLEEVLQQAEADVESATAELTTAQQASAEIRESIARAESQLQLNQSRLGDIESRQEQTAQQRQRSLKRVSDTAARIAQTEADAESAELEYREASDKLKSCQATFDELEHEIGVIQSRRQTRLQRQAELNETLGQFGRSISGGESQREGLIETGQRLQQRETELGATIQRCQEQRETARSIIESLQAEAASRNSALADSREQLRQLKTDLEGRRKRLSELSNQQAGMSQRAQVIEELEQTLEGINAGAKELLKYAQDPQRQGPMEEIVGLVADLVAVNVQHAALVDVALGEIAQYVLVRGTRLINEIAAETIRLNGRVGLIQLDSPPDLGTDIDVNLNGVNGVIGRADRLVQVQPEHTQFIRQLLGGTWVVKTLGVALHLHENHDGADRVRFVSLDGEIVESDGSVVVGPKSATSGLVSRRSELRALKRQLANLEVEIERECEVVQQLEQQVGETETTVEAQLNENTELASRLSDQRAGAETATQQLEDAESQRQSNQASIAEQQQKLARLESELSVQREQATAAESEQQQLATGLQSDQQRWDELQQQRSETDRTITSAKVQLAKSEQVLDGVQAQLSQLRDEHDEQQQLSQQHEQRQQEDQATAQTARQQIQSAQAQLTEQRTELEAIESTLQRLNVTRTDADAKRREVSIELRGKQDQLRLSEDRVRQAQSRIGQLQLQRQQLAERLRDDYGIDIAEIDDPGDGQEEDDREEIDQEITDLRQKLSAIGSVNLDALKELEDLESRYLAMDEQYQDLVQAKDSLRKIIARIDADSRQLFVETLEAIRTNFQQLFRQTFGGGQADILLEPGVDPLEAGVEIVATPPGKPEFNNSLLSGGEKALTAVSLLMAIFQFRPSPFCVLDEVDAPFDEANIGRFIDVLKSFLGWTKFVIVTHSKKTMTAATTLYGITMQESGVSKRVSVRFEDVSEDGEISADALQRADEDAA